MKGQTSCGSSQLGAALQSSSAVTYLLSACGLQEKAAAVLCVDLVIVVACVTHCL